MTSDPPPGGWKLEHHHGSAAELVAVADGMQGGPRRVLVMEPDPGALVLGSTQSASAPAHVSGIDVVRRRSGGGAVLLGPGDQCWVEVWVPRDDPLWVDDTGGSFLWLGEVWRAALGECGVASEVWSGPLHTGSWGTAVCFAGIGPGEVTSGGAKMVGISQRRSRRGARFSAAALVRFDPTELLEILEMTGLVGPGTIDERVVAELSDAAAGTGVRSDALAAAFLRNLPVDCTPSA